jgi:uncharacterized membrane protein
MHFYYVSSKKEILFLILMFICSTFCKVTTITNQIEKQESKSIELVKYVMNNELRNHNENSNDNEAFLTYLYNICVNDAACKKMYYQDKGSNILAFHFFVKKGLYNHLNLLYEGDFNVNPLNIISSIVSNDLKTREAINNIVSISENMARIVSNFSIKNSTNDSQISNYSFDDEQDNSDEQDQYNQLLKYIIETTLINNMYRYQSNQNNAVCYPGQTAQVSDDGLQINCVCEETHNCSQSVFDMTYINLALALLIVLGFLIICIDSFRIMLDWNIFMNIKTNNHVHNI